MQKALFAVLLIAASSLAAVGQAQTAGGACTGSATAGPDANGNLLKCNGSTWATVGGSSPATPTQTNVKASRAIGTIYRNTTGQTLYVNVSLTGKYNCLTDAAASPTTIVVAAGYTGAVTPNSFTVINNNYYACTGATASSVWIETQLPF